jgi:hypothetical protein
MTCLSGRYLNYELPDIGGFIMSATSRKPFNFREVSTKRFCLICNKGLKLNLLAKVPEAKYCFTHHKRQITIKQDMKAMQRDVARQGKPIY